MCYCQTGACHCYCSVWACVLKCAWQCVYERVRQCVYGCVCQCVCVCVWMWMPLLTVMYGCVWMDVYVWKQQIKWKHIQQWLPTHLPPRPLTHSLTRKSTNFLTSSSSSDSDVSLNEPAMGPQWKGHPFTNGLERDKPAHTLSFIQTKASRAGLLTLSSTICCALLSSVKRVGLLTLSSTICCALLSSVKRVGLLTLSSTNCCALLSSVTTCSPPDGLCRFISCNNDSNPDGLDQFPEKVLVFLKEKVIMRMIQMQLLVINSNYYYSIKINSGKFEKRELLL